MSNNFNNNFDNNNIETLQAELANAEAVVEQATAIAEAAEDRAITIREAIERHQQESRTAHSSAFEINMPNGTRIVLISNNDPRLNNPMPTGATIQPKQTATAGSR